MFFFSEIIFVNEENNSTAGEPQSLADNSKTKYRTIVSDSQNQTNLTSKAIKDDAEKTKCKSDADCKAKR